MVFDSAGIEKRLRSFITIHISLKPVMKDYNHDIEFFFLLLPSSLPTFFLSKNEAFSLFKVILIHSFLFFSNFISLGFGCSSGAFRSLLNDGVMCYMILSLFNTASVILLKEKSWFSQSLLFSAVPFHLCFLHPGLLLVTSYVIRKKIN